MQWFAPDDDYLPRKILELEYCFEVVSISSSSSSSSDFVVFQLDSPYYIALNFRVCSFHSTDREPLHRVAQTSLPDLFLCVSLVGMDDEKEPESISLIENSVGIITGKRYKLCFYGPESHRNKPLLSGGVINSTQHKSITAELKTISCRYPSITCKHGRPICPRHPYHHRKIIRNTSISKQTSTLKRKRTTTTTTTCPNLQPSPKREKQTPLSFPSLDPGLDLLLDFI